MRIALAAPEIGTLPTGNRATARRWAAIWRKLGHRVVTPACLARAVASAPGARVPAPDLLVALHARKSAPALAAFRRAFPSRPAIVALSGTDLYPHLTAAARRAVAAASRLVVLQELALAALPAPSRGKARVIYQSALATPRASRPRRRAAPFTVLVAAHLRAVKDPLRAAEASRLLPPDSRIRVLHAGAALSPAWASRAKIEARRSPRYQWLGALSPAATRRQMAQAQLLVVSSRLEGGPNVIGEAAVAGLPVLATRIPGNVGLLGPGYAGYFPAGGTAALAALLRRAETRPAFLARLRRQVRSRAPLFTPRREQAAWRRLLAELMPGSGAVGRAAL